MPKPRYVTIDLNVLDEGLSHYIYDEDHVVLPHMIISDLAGNKRCEKHAQCLPGWLNQRGEQIWIAHDWATLEELESSPGNCVGTFGWRDDDGSKVLRSGAKNTPEQWINYFQNFETTKGRRIVEDGRSAFLDGCKQIVIGMKANDTDLVSKIRSSKTWHTDTTEIIRQPIWGHVLGLVESKYQNPEWNNALERFPDEMAIGRMSRIMCWYSILQAGDIRLVQENDFEDTAYAHAASYTGYLATEDNKLREMVEAVFPHVVILTKGDS